MILVLGSAVVHREGMDKALALSLQHVARSRLEPGCMAHALHIDAENPQRLVFVEEWESLEMLWQHFAVPATRSFAESLRDLAAQPTTLSIYDSRKVPLPGAGRS